MTRINLANSFALTSKTGNKTVSALLFGTLLIGCSVVTGCSSEKPQPVTSNQPAVNQIPAPVATSTPPASVPEAPKPAPKKIVRKRPATVTYTDKTYGVSFDYPRRYAIETGNAASELVATSPLPMNFVQPGGSALAAIELPETSFPSTDFSSAFFNVSVNKALTAEQCEEFSVPQPKASDSSAAGPQSSKLMVGDMELYGAEAVTGDGPRQSDTKYFHIFQNGTCYEFALNLTTNASEIEAGMKHVDRDKVFDRLSKILATVRISEAEAAEATAGVGAAVVDRDKTGAETDSLKQVAPKTSEVSQTNANAPAAPTTTQTSPTVPSVPAVTEASPQ